MEIISSVKSADNHTIKYVLRSKLNDYIEATYVDYYNKHVVCFSTMVGCPNRCVFCSNGYEHKNFVRVLTAHEMYQQIMAVVHKVKEDVGYDLENPRLSTVPFSKMRPTLFSAMGSGEPLCCCEELPEVFGFLKGQFPHTTRFVLSTTGNPVSCIIPLHYKLDELLRDRYRTTFSLHSARQEVRDKLMPGSPKISAIMDVLSKYQIKHHRHMDYNVLLFDNGINNTKEDAEAIANLLREYKLTKLVTIKLSIYNPVERCSLAPLSKLQIFEFGDILESLGVDYEFYRTNGSDVGAACGQLYSYKRQEMEKKETESDK